MNARGGLPWPWAVLLLWLYRMKPAAWLLSQASVEYLWLFQVHGVSCKWIRGLDDGGPLLTTPLGSVPVETLCGDSTPHFPSALS